MSTGPMKTMRAHVEQRCFQRGFHFRPFPLVFADEDDVIESGLMAPEHFAPQRSARDNYPNARRDDVTAFDLCFTTICTAKYHPQTYRQTI
jgi:hypothetical protein